MIYDDALREAAKRADKAVNKAMAKYARDRVTDEDDITGVLVAHLDTELEGQIGNLTWDTSVVRHGKGVAAEEKRIGADILIHVELKSPTLSYSKGVLVQAKRHEPGYQLTRTQAEELRSQCKKMLSITPASFVFDYAKGSMRCASATAIAGSHHIVLYDDSVWTSYRFFLELFRCPIGDIKITSAAVADLPVPNIVTVSARPN